MRKNNAGLFLLLNIFAATAYWAAVLVSMRQRIGAEYGQYELFETLSMFRSLVIPLAGIILGAFFLFSGSLKAWQYLLILIAVPAMLEILGNFAAMLLYGLSFSSASEMLEMSLRLFTYAVVVIILWGIVTLIWFILQTIRKKKEASVISDIQREYEYKQQAADEKHKSVLTGPVNTYSSSGAPFAGYVLLWIVFCVFGAFFITAALMIYWLDTKNLVILYTGMGVGVVIAIIMAVARGIMHIEIANGFVVVKCRSKVVGTYAFSDYLMTPSRTVHLLAGVVPIRTDRYIVMTDKAQFSNPVKCRNFSEKTFTRLMDEITAGQRAIIRKEEKDTNTAAAALAAYQSSPGLNRTGHAGVAHIAPGVKYSQIAAEEKILPMPGEKDFVSLDFTLNKAQMVEVEQRRYRNIILGLFGCSIALYAAWFFGVYKALQTPMPNLPYLTGGIIGVLFLIFPAVAMLTSFAKEKRRIPVSIVIESERFIIDKQVFERAKTRGFTMTYPGEAAIGTTSHRMHLRFVYEGRRYSYTLGSGTVANASFPDYNLLYKAFDAQREFVEHPPALQQARRMIETTVKLSPYTIATIKVPRREELAEIVGILSGNNVNMLELARQIVNNPYKFAAEHTDDFLRYGYYNPFLTNADSIVRAGIAVLLETHHYAALLAGDSSAETMLYKLQGIAEAYTLPVNLSVLRFQDDAYAVDELQTLNDRLLPQGFQIVDMPVSTNHCLAFCPSGSVQQVKELAKKCEWDIPALIG